MSRRRSAAGPAPLSGAVPSTNALQALALAAAGGIFLVVLMGSLVTDTGSGRGCGGTWPLCDGRLVPAAALQPLIEYSHRAVSALVGLMVIVLAVWAWRAAGRCSEVRALAVIGAAFVLLQGLLGAAAVVWGQSPAVMALHFGFSLISFAGVLLLAVTLRQGGGPAPAPLPRGFTARVWITLAWVYGVVYLGAYVAHSQAALACPDWPLCTGRAIPALHGATAVQFAHRLAAAGAVVLVAWLQLGARRLRAVRPDIYRAARLALLLVVLQAASGGLVVLSGISLASTLLHQSLIACLFGTLAYLALQTLRGDAGGSSTRMWAAA